MGNSKSIQPPSQFVEPTTVRSFSWHPEPTIGCYPTYPPPMMPTSIYGDGRISASMMSLNHQHAPIDSGYFTTTADDSELRRRIRASRLSLNDAAIFDQQQQPPPMFLMHPPPPPPPIDPKQLKKWKKHQKKLFQKANKSGGSLPCGQMMMMHPPPHYMFANAPPPPPPPSARQMFNNKAYSVENLSHGEYEFEDVPSAPRRRPASIWCDRKQNHFEEDNDQMRRQQIPPQSQQQRSSNNTTSSSSGMSPSSRNTNRLSLPIVVDHHRISSPMPVIDDDDELPLKITAEAATILDRNEQMIREHREKKTTTTSDNDDIVVVVHPRPPPTTTIDQKVSDHETAHSFVALDAWNSIDNISIDQKLTKSGYVVDVADDEEMRVQLVPVLTNNAELPYFINNEQQVIDSNKRTETVDRNGPVVNGVGQKRQTMSSSAVAAAFTVESSTSPSIAGGTTINNRTGDMSEIDFSWVHDLERRLDREQQQQQVQPKLAPQDIDAVTAKPIRYFGGHMDSLNNNNIRMMLHQPANSDWRNRELDAIQSNVRSKAAMFENSVANAPTLQLNSNGFESSNNNYRHKQQRRSAQQQHHPASSSTQPPPYIPHPDYYAPLPIDYKNDDVDAPIAQQQRYYNYRPAISSPPPTTIDDRRQQHVEPIRRRHSPSTLVNDTLIDSTSNGVGVRPSESSRLLSYSIGDDLSAHCDPIELLQRNRRYDATEYYRQNIQAERQRELEEKKDRKLPSWLTSRSPTHYAY